MSVVITLFSVGFVLAAIEVLVPGGVLGALAGLCLLAGVVTSFGQFGVTGGVVATVVAGVIGLALVYFEFVVLPKTQLAKTFSLSSSGAGRSQPAVADRAVIGREAFALTTLAPSGYVEIDGQRYEAFCQSGLAPAGAHLRVVEVDTFRLVVTQIKPSL